MSTAESRKKFNNNFFKYSKKIEELIKLKKERNTRNYSFIKPKDE